MKRIYPVAAILLLAALGLYLFLRPKQSTPLTTAPSSQAGNPPANNPPGAPSISSPNPGSNSPPTISSLRQAQPANLAAMAGEPVPESGQPLNLSPEAALQNVRTAVRQYGQMFGGNPVGTNPEITRQLNGNNPRHINFIGPQPGLRINADGELVDAWGTPYFFHQLSGTEMEIHSAGPDKIMWTSDDLVTK